MRDHSCANPYGELDSLDPNEDRNCTPGGGGGDDSGNSTGGGDDNSTNDTNETN